MTNPYRAKCVNFNLDEKLGSANYIKTILNLFLINSLSAMNFLVYKNFGYKDLK